MILKFFFGFLTGLVSSLGVGGGFILLIYLIVFEKINQIQAQAINLFFFILVALFSMIGFVKNKLIDFKIMWKCVAFGVIGVVFGLLAEFIVPVQITKKFFALFLILMGLKELFS